jgi:AraC family transcriptional activator of mtrCDE
MFGAPWRLDNPESLSGQIPYHIVLAGSAILDDMNGRTLQRLEKGDILILPHGIAHILHDGSGKPAAPARQRAGSTLTIDENDGTGDRLDMLCGSFLLSAAHEKLIRAYLPAQFVVSNVNGDPTLSDPIASSKLSDLVRLMRLESTDENLGGRAMLSALSTAMFALALRLATERSEAPVGILALASNPRLAPALSALFNEPGRAWTLPDLATRCNMSRATFIRQFQTRLGRTASDLLTDIRMTLAANELRSSSASTGAVAETAGYQSEAAFQRTFKQHMGVTPAQYRRQAQSAIADS